MGSFKASNTIVPTINATVVTADDLEIDSTTLSIDADNNKVGIGLTTPKTELTVEGTVTLKEQSSASGDTAAYGQIWVKSNSPNDLYFTNDAGNDVRITNGTSLAAAASSSAVAGDDITTGDGAIALETSSGNVLVDSQAGTTTVDGHTGVNIVSSNSGQVDITSAADIDINATTGIAADGTTVSIDGTDDSNFTVTGSGKDLDLVVAGGGTQELRLTSAGTGAAAINIDTSAGGIDIDSADMITIDAADEITITTTSADGHISLVTAHTAGVAFHLDANADADSEVQIDAGILDIDVTAAATIDAVGVAIGAGSGELDLTTTGTLDINANALDMDLTDSSNITITSSTGGEDLTIAQVGANDSSILITAAGTGADAVSIDATAGSMVIAPSLADGQTLKLGKNGAVEMVFTPHGTAGNEKISLTNTSGTATDAIKILADAGGITLDADSTNASAIDIDSAGGFDLDAAGTVAIDSTAGSITVGAALADGQTLKLGKNGAVETIIAPHGTAGSEAYSVTNTSGDTDGAYGQGAILFDAAAGGMGIKWADGKDLWAEGGRAIITANENAAECIKLHADAGTSQTIVIVNDAGTDDGAEAEGAILIEATDGGIGLHGADDKKIWAEAGQVIVTANANSADAIKLHADAGANQTIVLLNDAGTAEGAITLTSTAGGIDLNAAAGKDVDISGGQINLTSAHDTASSIYIRANAGTSETIKIHADQGSGEGSIELTSDAGGVDINAAADKDVTVDAGQILLTSAHDTASAIYLRANAGTSETIKIHADQGNTDGAAGAGSILLVSDAGGMGLSWADTKDLWAEGGRAVVTANENAADAIKLHADAGANQTIVLLNDEGTAEGAVTITSTAGGIDLNANAAKDVTINAGQILLTSAHNTEGSILIEADAGVDETISIHADQGTGVATAGIGNATNASINLISDVGGICLASGLNADLSILLEADAGTDETIGIHSNQGTGVATAGFANCLNASIAILSDDGGIALASGLNGAGAIFLEADAGTSETIYIHSNQGTGAASIELDSDVGGITLDAGLDITLSADGGNITMDDGTLTIFDFNVDDTTMTIHDDQDTGDKFSIAVAQHGATTITTVDDDAAAADLTLTIDGDTIIQAEGTSVARAVGSATSSTTNCSKAFSSLTPYISFTSNGTLYPGDSGAIVLISDQDVTVTLPDSGNAATLGCRFTFIINNGAAGDKIITCADTSNEQILGKVQMYDVDVNPCVEVSIFQSAPGNGNYKLDFNGTTTGAVFSKIEIMAVATDQWFVLSSEIYATGTPATPFASS